MAKLLASQAAWLAANASLDAHGGYGFAVEFDIERKFRETRLLLTAPINNNLVLAFVGPRPVYSCSSRTAAVEIAAAMLPVGEGWSSDTAVLPRLPL